MSKLDAIDGWSWLVNEYWLAENDLPRWGTAHGPARTWAPLPPRPRRLRTADDDATYSVVLDAWRRLRKSLAAPLSRAKMRLSVYWFRTWVFWSGTATMAWLADPWRRSL